MRIRPALVIFALACTTSWALDSSKLPSQYPARLWTAAQGLATDTVYRSRQAPDGHLWIVTGVGVSRFDGAQFTNFVSGTTPGYPAGVTHSVLPARDGTIWVAGDGGIGSYRNGSWRTYTERDGLTGLRADFLAEVGGAIWAATPAGVRYWKNGRFEGPAWDAQLPSSYVHQIVQDDQGALWLATKQGLVKEYEGHLRVFTTRDGLRDNDVSAVFVDRQGTVWFGTHGAGLGRWRNGRIELFPLYSWLPTSSRSAVHAFAEDPDGGIWMALFYGGLVRLNGDRHDVYTTKDGLPNDEVYNVNFDREGNLWVAMARGGGLLELRDGKFTNYNSAQGLAGGSAAAIAQAPDGSIWVGTPEHGILRLQGQQFTQEGVPRQLRSIAVKCLLAAHDGSVWVGSWGSEIARFSRGGVTCFTPPGVTPNSSQTMYEDRDGSIWVGYIQGGAARIHDGRIDVVSLPGLSRVSISRFLRTRDGQMWMTSPSHGLLRWSPDRLWVSPEMKGVVPTWLMEDREGGLWVTTNGNGLYYFRNSRVYHFTRENGLPDNLLHNVFEDNTGDLWLQAFSGIVHVPRAGLQSAMDGRAGSLHPQVFDAADGLSSRERTASHACQDRDGRLWFPNLGGVSAIDPRRIYRNAVRPPVYVETVGFGGRESAPLAGAAFGPGDGSLSFRYAALSFSVPESNRFRYKLEGLDSEWVEAGDRKVAYYTGVAPGHYRFLVEGSNNDGVWSHGEFPFSIQPRIYQTWWLRMLACALAAAALFVIVQVCLRVRTRNLLRVTRRLESEVARRTSELERLANTDSLTGLLNRGAGEAKLAAQLMNRQPVSIMLIDVNDFKHVNDRFGHVSGDQVLKTMAEILGNSIRPADIACRWGGDEFLIMMSTDRPIAEQRAKQLCELLKTRCQLTILSKTHEVSVSASVGIAVARTGETVADLLTRADMDLYESKREAKKQNAQEIQEAVVSPRMN